MGPISIRNLYDVRQIYGLSHQVSFLLASPLAGSGVVSSEDDIVAGDCGAYWTALLASLDLVSSSVSSYAVC